MIQALMVGSRESWRVKLTPKLARHGIELRWLWEGKGDAQSIPSGCGLCLIMTDHNAHALSVPAAKLARSAGVPLVHMPHRWATAQPRLVAAGFATLPTPDPDPDPEPHKETMSTPAPVPPTPPKLAPVYNPYLRLLAADPFLDRVAVLALRTPGVSTTNWKTLIGAARKELGIICHARFLRVYVPVYAAKCASLGIKPAVVNVHLTATYSAWTDHLDNLASYSGRAQGPRTKPDPAVPASPAPDLGPALALFDPVPPAPLVAPPSAPDDLRVAVGLLREIMAKHDYVHIGVPATGSVTFRRRVVVEQEGTIE